MPAPDAPATLLATECCGSGTLRFRSYATTAAGKSQPVTVLVDTGSQVSLARGVFLRKIIPSPLIRVGGIHKDTTVDHKGSVHLQLVEEPGSELNRLLEVSCFQMDTIGPPSANIDVLLNADMALELGYITARPNPSTTPWHELPPLAWRQPRRLWMRDVPTIDTSSLVTMAAILAVAQLPAAEQLHQLAGWQGGTVEAVVHCAPTGGDHCRPDCYVSTTSPTAPLRATPVHPTASSDADTATQPGGGGHGPLPSLLSEQRLGEVLERRVFLHAGERAYSRADLAWGVEGRDYTPEQRAECERLVDEYEDVFSPEAMPPPNDCSPVILELKHEDAKLPFIKQHRWGVNEMTYLQRVRRQWESFGILTRPDRPVSACRISVAEKSDIEARVCPDLRPINAVLKPHRGYMTDGIRAVEEAADSKHPFRSSFDMSNAYMSIRIAPESQQLLGVTFPDDDGRPVVMQMTRLPFGLGPSGFILENYLNSCFQELPVTMRMSNLFRFVDDMLVASATFAEHMQHLRALFDCCRRHGIKLSWPKSKFLSSEMEFYGYKVSPTGVTLTDQNVAALRGLPYPTTVSETRHVIGVLSVSKKWVHHFAERMAPLYDLVKKNSQFKWTPAHATAMDGVRDDLMRQIRLTKFDPTKQLVIYSDASQVGIGSFLAMQNDDGTLDTIAYFSKRLSPAMQRNGATVREAYGVIMALQAAKPYVMCTHRPTIVYSDARSLSFVQQSTRSELSVRLLQQVEGLSFELRYVAGRLNTAADGLSRLGMEGARTLSAAGYASALDDLLEHLSDSPVRAALAVWVYMSEHAGAYQQVQTWRSRHGRSTAMEKQAPTPATIAQHHDLRILRFDVHTCIEQARAVMLQPSPAAILMPLDLVADIQVDDDGNVVPAMRHALAAARKRCYLGSNQVWLLHNVADAADDVCLMSCAIECPSCLPAVVAPAPRQNADRVRLEDDGHEPWPEGDGTDPLHYGETRRLVERLSDRIDVTQWPELQPSIASFKPKYRKRLVTDDRGLLWRRRDGAPDQVVVPDTFRVLLMTMTHAATNHMDARTLAAELQHSYWWPSIAADCEQFHARCNQCQLSQSRKLRHHNLYAASKFSMPREEMGVDVKRLVVGDQVFNLLLMVDRFSRFATFAVLERRNADSIIAALDEHFSLFGPPKRLTVDGGKEFLSAATRAWLRRQGTAVREPLPYYPQAAGSVERLWSVIKGALRRMTSMHHWRAELRQCMFQYNTVVRRATQSSPYLLFFGGAPNSQVHRHAQAAGHYEDLDLPAEAIAIQSVLAEGIEAHRSTAAAGGNLQRANTAITLNRSGIPPPNVDVGQPVWYYQDISGNSEGAADRPRPALRTWRPGVVRAVEGVAITVTTPSGETLRRHVSDVKPRAADSPYP